MIAFFLFFLFFVNNQVFLSEFKPLFLMAKQLIYVLDGTFLDDRLDRIPLHKSMTLFMGGVGVKAIDGTVEGAMLKFFQRD